LPTNSVSSFIDDFHINRRSEDKGETQVTSVVINGYWTPESAQVRSVASASR
jgi:hypothetical protein